MIADRQFKQVVQTGFCVYKVCKMSQAHAGADQCKQQEGLEQCCGMCVSIKQNTEWHLEGKNKQALVLWSTCFVAQSKSAVAVCLYLQVFH